MKKTFYSLLTLLFTLSVSSAFALEIEAAPILSSSTETSLSIDWEDVEGALGYYIYYSEKSGTQDGYNFEGVDLIESSDTLLENLAKDTDYYVAVTVVDDNGNESQFSPEGFFTTSIQSSVNLVGPAFALEGVVVVSANEIQLSFNAVLDPSEDAVRELKITEKQSGEEIFVSETALDSSDPMKFTATTSDLIEETQYELTIVSVQDADKNNIESGVDGVTTFLVPKGSTTSYEETKQAPVETVDLSVQTPDLNAALPEEPVGKTGQVLSDDDIIKTAQTAAVGNETLPQTGPETILLLLLAVMLGGGLFFIYAKKA